MQGAFRVGIGAATAVVMAGSASAGLVPVGDPMDGGSWTQQFYEDGSGSGAFIDFMGVRMTSDAPDAFESNVFRNFTGTKSSGWADAGVNQPPFPRVGGASGPRIKPTGGSDILVNVWFAGSKSDPLEFDYAAFDGDTLVILQHIVWNGSGWGFSNLTIGTYDWDRDDFERSIVPLPTSCALAGAGLLGIGWRRRRMSI